MKCRSRLAGALVTKNTMGVIQILQNLSYKVCSILLSNLTHLDDLLKFG